MAERFQGAWNNPPDFIRSRWLRRFVRANRGPFLMLLFALPLAVLGFLQGREHTRFTDPPRDLPKPVVTFNVSAPGQASPQRAYNVSVSIAMQGCTNPVRVMARFLLTSDLVAQVMQMSPGSARDVGFAVWGTRNVSDLALYQGFGEEPELPAYDEVFSGGVQFGATTAGYWKTIRNSRSIEFNERGNERTLNRGYEAKLEGVAGEMEPSIGMNQMLAIFNADWIVPRSHGTCYLLLPNLRGTSAAIARGQLLAWQAGWDQTNTVGAVYGSIVLQGWEQQWNPPPGYVLVDDSSRSERFDDRAWTCDGDGVATNRRLQDTDCEGYAAFAEPNARGETNSGVFLWGVVFGTGVAGLLQAVFSFKRPPADD